MALIGVRRVLSTTSKEQQFSTHFLNKFLSFGVERGGVFVFFCILFFSSVCDWCVGERLILFVFVFQLVAELYEGFFDIPGHV